MTQLEHLKRLDSRAAEPVPPVPVRENKQPQKQQQNRQRHNPRQNKAAQAP